METKEVEDEILLPDDCFCVICATALRNGESQYCVECQWDMERFERKRNKKKA